MTYPKHVWDQLKAKTAGELISVLEKDGWHPDSELKTERVYLHPDGRRVTIHYHMSKRSYGRKLLKGLLDDIGWSVGDMERLKLIKKK